MSDAPHAALDEAAERLEREFPGYLALARRLAAEIGLPTTPAARVERAIDLPDETSQVNADAPTTSSTEWGRAAKTVIGRFVRWYMLHMAGQVANLGSSASWLGRVMYDYTAGLEAEVVRLRDEVDQLRARVEALESWGYGAQGSGGP